MEESCAKQILHQDDRIKLYRQGRYVVAAFTQAHRVISTSPVLGGQQEGLSAVFNHQSCEPAGHAARAHRVLELGEEAYHLEICREIGLDPQASAQMGTAANMQYVATDIQESKELSVLAVATAGVEGNAACAGDPATYRETPDGIVRDGPLPGTINIMLFCNVPLTPGALARSASMLVEGKFAALQELSVGSKFSTEPATGTGTDQYVVACPLGGEGEYAYTGAGHHVRLGELMGKAVKATVKKALHWQNGLDPAMSRGMIHQMRRFGFEKAKLVDFLKKMGSEPEMQLLDKNFLSLNYDPQVAAGAAAFSAILDRIRWQVLPAEAGQEALRRQCAQTAISLACRDDLYVRAMSELAHHTEPMEMWMHSLLLGWQYKWMADEID